MQKLVFIICTFSIASGFHQEAKPITYLHKDSSYIFGASINSPRLTAYFKFFNSELMYRINGTHLLVVADVSGSSLRLNDPSGFDKNCAGFAS